MMKRFRKKIQQREQLLLKSRLKQQDLKNNDENYNKALCDRKRKRYSIDEWNVEEEYFHIYNMLNLTNNNNTNLTFHDLLDAMNFLEIGTMIEDFDDERIENCLVPWLNIEKVKSFYIKLERSETNPHFEKEIQALQLKAFSIILKCTPLENMDLKLCVEKHSSKGLSLVECVLNKEEVKIDDLGEIYCLAKIITETGLYNIIDENLTDLFESTDDDEIKELVCHRALDCIQHSRFFNESCRFFTFCWNGELPREFNYHSFFQQLKNVDSSIDADTSFTIKSVLMQCFSMKNDNLQEFINNGLWDIIKKLRFSYRDNVEALDMIYECIGFKPVLASPLFVECLQSVPTEDEDYESGYDYINSPCVDMFYLLRKIIKREKIDNVKAVFTKDFFNFIRNHFDGCDFMNEETNPMRLITLTLSFFTVYPNETKEIQEENSEIIQWMKQTVKLQKD